MKRLIIFCDLCFTDGAYRMASAEYITDDKNRVAICSSCSEIVESAGYPPVPLRLPEGFLEDIRDGLLIDADALED